MDQLAFVIPVPVAFDEPAFRVPPLRYQRSNLLEPVPFSQVGEASGKLAQFCLGRIVTVEPCSRTQHLQVKQSGIHGRQFNLTMTQASIHVEKVIEESLVSSETAGRIALRKRSEESEREDDTLARFCTGDPAPFSPDYVGGQLEPDRGDAAERRRGPAIGDEPVRRVGAFPEETESPVLKVGEEARQFAPAVVANEHRGLARKRG